MGGGLDSSTQMPAGLQRLSSHAASGFDQWREEIMLRVMRVDVEVPDRDRFLTRLRVLNLPKISMIERRTTPSVVRRTKALALDGDDAVIFNLPWRGTMDFRCGDTQERAHPGEAVILPLDRPSSLRTTEGLHGLSIRLSREVARPVFHDLDGWMARRLPMRPEACVLLRVYTSTLVAGPQAPSTGLAQVAGLQLRELLAYAFAPDGDLARAAPGGGIRAARRQAILQDIELRLTDPGLNATAVGRRLGLSGRYVQQLMEQGGISFSDHVRTLRLDHACRLLRDPALADHRIADIAAMAGFGDLSTFNRLFRQRFGETPKDIRRSRA